ncbi:hypothetical protein [Spirosoma litoris]
MNAQQLVNSGLFEIVTTEGRETLILKKPVRIVLPKTILNQLANIYPKDHETGGFLYASVNTTTGTLTVVQVAPLPNQSTSDTTFQASGTDYQRGITTALQNDLLPLRFHTHPVQTMNSLYNIQSLNFFQKTSSTDRHSSYLPISLNGQAMVLPDCLVSPNDRDGNSIRFSIYNGFVAPSSFAALLPNEQIFIGLVVLVLVVVWALLGYKKALSGLLVCGIIGAIVFIQEKRPTYTYTDTELTITI